MIWGGHGGRGAVVFKMFLGGIVMLVGGVLLALRAYTQLGELAWS